MNKKKIFVADDDLGILEAMKMMLDYAGYTPCFASGEIISSIKKARPDLILLDIRMSGVDGKEICRKLKKDTRTKDIPVILLSANKDTEQIAQEVGADAYLEKPFDMNILIEKIEDLTKNKVYEKSRP